MSWREDELLQGLLAALGSESGHRGRRTDLQREAVLLGPGDDAAVWRPDGDVVVTVDSVVAGVDWLPERTPPAAIGHRALAVNLSDLAAMGATPRGYVLALELPPDAIAAEVLAAAAGLRQLADQHGVALLGGDLGCSPGPARWTVTALGTLRGKPLRRDAVRAGDRIWLVDTQGTDGIGLAAAGLAVLQRLGEPAWAGALVARHRWPQPLVAAGMALAQLEGPPAALDLSDGLMRDARRLAAASGVALTLQLPRPAWLTPEVTAFAHTHQLDWRQWVAAGGDDYALLVAARPQLDLGPLGGVAIGSAASGSGVRLWLDGQEVDGQGYAHGAPT